LGTNREAGEVNTATKLADRLTELLGADKVLREKEDLIPYGFDGTAVIRQLP
jgi:glycolate oxidase